MITSALVRETTALVQANSFEQLKLWEERFETGYGRSSWEQNCGSHAECIGRIAGEPVVIEMNWVRVDGRLIAFWGMSSDVRVQSMAESWLESKLSGVPPTDAMNFARAFDRQPVLSNSSVGERG